MFFLIFLFRETLVLLWVELWRWSPVDASQYPEALSSLQSISITNMHGHCQGTSPLMFPSCCSLCNSGLQCGEWPKGCRKHEKAATRPLRDSMGLPSTGGFLVHPYKALWLAELHGSGHLSCCAVLPAKLISYSPESGFQLVMPGSLAKGWSHFDLVRKE